MNAERYWRTRDGREIEICRMEDAHLRAAFRMMRSRCGGTFSCREEGIQYIVQLAALGEEIERRDGLHYYRRATQIADA